MKHDEKRHVIFSAESDIALVVEYRGLMTPMPHERLVRLLDLEQEALRSLANDPVKGKTPARDASLATDADTEIERSVNHASLSNRVRRIHSYSVKSKKLRPSHVGLLSELMQNFDWNLPAYENVTLKNELTEIGSWSSVPEGLRSEIRRFLERYVAEVAERRRGRR